MESAEHRTALLSVFRLLELGGLLLGCELGLRLLGLGILIGSQEGGVDAVCLCGIHGILKERRQRGSLRDRK